MNSYLIRNNIMGFYYFINSQFFSQKTHKKTMKKKKHN